MPISSSLAVALLVSANASAASRTINRFATKTEKRLAALSERGSRMLSKGLVDIEIGKQVGNLLVTPIKEFAKLESSATDLKVSMMDAAGKVSPAFKKLSDLALQLGNKLPGSTADMNHLFSTMLNNGAKANDILNGTGKAAAYLAVGMKMPFEEAGEMAQRLQFAAGVANKDMIKFMDTISRTKLAGVNVRDLQYAFSKSAGTLKVLGLQGLKASKNVTTMFAILNKAGVSGETIGTSMSQVFNTFLNPKKMAAFNAQARKMGLNFKFVNEKTGKFLGVKNMMKQLDKLKSLTPLQRSMLEGKLFASSGQSKNAFDLLIGAGSKGFGAMADKMKSQASLNKKVNAQLSTLTNIWDAFTGTLDNTLALIGQKYSKQIKGFVKSITSLAASVGGFVDKHRGLIKWLGIGIGSFAALSVATGAFNIVVGGGIRNLYNYYKGIKKISGMAKEGHEAIKEYRIALAMNKQAKQFAGQATMFQKVGKSMKTFGKAAKSGVVGGIKGIGRAFSVVGKLLKTNLIVLIITAIAVAAFLIIKHWKPISKFFIKLWDWVKNAFSAAWQWIKRMFLNYTPYGLIIKNWDKIADWFAGLWDKVKGYFGAAWDWIKSMFMKYSLPGIIMSNWGTISTFFANLWEGIKKKFLAFVNFFKSTWGWINKHIIQPVAGWFGGDNNVNVNAGGGSLPQPVPVRNNSVNAPFTMNFALSGAATQADADRIVTTVKKHLPGLMKDYNHNLGRTNTGY